MSVSFFMAYRSFWKFWQASTPATIRRLLKPRHPDSRIALATLAHESIHWTGSEKRLDRIKKFANREAYAFEELVAEIGACFLGAQLGIEPEFDQSAAYVESWLQALKDDKRAIFRAASEAQKAADFLMDTADRRDEAAA